MDQDATAISGEAMEGLKSAKILSAQGLIQQDISVTQDGIFRFTVHARGASLIGAKSGDKIYFSRTRKSQDFEPIHVTFRAEAADFVTLFLGYSDGTVRYDDASVASVPNDTKLSPSVLRKASGGSGLSPDLPPSSNFDLRGWNLSIPIDMDSNGKSDTISERELAAGFVDPRFFFTGPDGGMVFIAPIAGARTSKNTKFTRTELREMLRRGDASIATRDGTGRPTKNNWVLSTAPPKAKMSAGGVDGVMEATLRVDHVTTTGRAGDIGRVIIGQIHAKDDEPIRLYYRKLPGHARGSIYFAHEPKMDRPDIFIDLLGSRDDQAPDPIDGIALGEMFSYRIETLGNQLNVTLIQNGIERAMHSLNMSGSGYDAADDFLYFKAGVYNQNRTGHPEDYVQATFYRLKTSHGHVDR